MSQYNFNVSVFFCEIITPPITSAKFVFKEPLHGYQFVASPENIHIAYYLRQRLSYTSMQKETAT